LDYLRKAERIPANVKISRAAETKTHVGFQPLGFVFSA